MTLLGGVSRPRVCGAAREAGGSSPEVDPPIRLDQPLTSDGAASFHASRVRSFIVPHSWHLSVFTCSVGMSFRNDGMLPGVNDDTFISALLAEAGGVNALAGVSPRYPTVSPEALVEGGVVLLSSEPFPFKERHREELCALGVAPERIFLVDGELCSWHGARLAEALPMLRAMAPVWAARCPAR